jgi:hypothetical protein
MSTPVQENLVSSNNSYAASFTKGDLPLPPGKRYTVGMFLVTPQGILCSDISSDLYGC